MEGAGARTLGSVLLVLHPFTAGGGQAAQPPAAKDSLVNLTLDFPLLRTAT